MSINNCQPLVALCAILVFLITSCAPSVRGGTTQGDAIDIHDAVVGYMKKSDELLSFCSLVHEDSVSISNINVLVSHLSPSISSFQKDVIRIKYGIEEGSISQAEYLKYRRQESLSDWERVKIFISNGGDAIRSYRLGGRGFDLLVSEPYSEIIPGRIVVFTEVYPVYPDSKSWGAKIPNLYMRSLFVFTLNSMDTVFTSIRIE